MSILQNAACTICFLFIPAVFASEFEVYFNHNSESSYTDPYRKVQRPGDNLEAVLIREISNAKSSIFLAVQELRLPLVAKALIERYRQGVDVKVIIENDYNMDLVELHELITLKPQRRGEEFMAKAPRPGHVGQRDYYIYLEFFQLVDANENSYVTPRELDQRDAIHMLRKAAVPLKDDTADGSLGSGLMHHKFVVIDHQRVVISSANFTMSGVHGDFANLKTMGNANSMIVTTSNELADIFITEFEIMWGKRFHKPLFGVNKPYRGRQSPKDLSSEVTVQFSPTSRSMPWKYSVNGLIGETLSKSGQESLLSLFVFSDQTISDILEDRARKNRGFKVGLLIEPKFAYRYYSELLDIMGVALRNPKCEFELGNRPWGKGRSDVGVPSLARGDLLHHKFAVVDDQTVIMGSQNWSASANYTNDENVIVIKNKQVAKAFKTEFNRLNSRARHGIPQSLQRRIQKAEENCRPLVLP